MPLLPASEVFTPPPGHCFNDAPITDTTPYEEWGYTVAYEADAEGNAVPDWGNTAMFRIHGMTEPVLVTKPTHIATFTVSVLSGQGKLIRSFSSGAAEEVKLEEGDEVTISPGQAYAYLNTGDSDLILKDVAMPAFQPGDEVQLGMSSSYPSELKPRQLPGSSYCPIINHEGETDTILLSNGFMDLLGQAMASVKA